MNIELWIWSLQLLHLSLHAASQFLPPPGLPFPFPPQLPDGSPMAAVPPMPPMPPMPLPPPQSLSQQPMPLPMPLPMSMNQQRLPVMVMPYYSKNEKPRTKYSIKKKRRVPKRHLDDSSSDSDGSDSGSNEFEFRAKKRQRKSRRQVLTPVVSYITKDGYVVYQKKIKKERAKDWLELGRKKNYVGSREESGELLEDVKRKLRHAKKRSHDD